MADAKKILVVDDEMSIREILVDILTDEDYEVIEAKNGKVGLEVAASAKPDLIISDVQMPEMDGVSFLKGLPACVTEMPVFVFLSGFCDITSDDAQNIGAQGIISKPFDIFEIVETVEKFLLPAAEKWKFTDDYTVTNVLNPASGSFENNLNFEGVLFGRDGFFFPQSSVNPEPRSIVSFEIEIKDKGLTLKGVGRIEWERSAPAGAAKVPGVGVKIIGLEGDGPEAYEKLTKAANILPIIPNQSAQEDALQAAS